MATCGVDTIIIDCKADMAEGCFDIIQAQVTLASFLFGTIWLSGLLFYLLPL
jgi:hypothetical protein